MFRSALIISATLAVALSASSGAFAKGKYHMAIYDNNGNKLFDDGKLDGKGCVVGKQAVFDPKTGGIKVVNAAKCNF